MTLLLLAVCHVLFDEGLFAIDGDVQSRGLLSIRVLEALRFARAANLSSLIALIADGLHLGLALILATFAPAAGHLTTPQAAVPQKVARLQKSCPGARQRRQHADKDLWPAAQEKTEPRSQSLRLWKPVSPRAANWWMPPWAFGKPKGKLLS